MVTGDGTTTGGPVHDTHYCLSEVDLFRDLSRKEMAELGARAPLRDVAAGQVLYSPQRPTETLFIIKRGRVRLFQIGSTGQPVTTALLGPGTVFGEVPLIGIRMGGNWAEALEPSQLCLMSPHDVRELLLADPRITRRINEHMTAHIAELEHRLTDMACKTLPERLASTLWTLTKATPPKEASEPVRLTHQQLAGLVNATRERTTTALGDLAENGLIRLHRGKITVTSRERLLIFAEGGGRSPTDVPYRQ
ncbi:Crp/Fnr family transcriptional regulator [Saccharopolyspora mangrovi]|uniref:Crp/Fnr family transcriptional regulator n=1 Tax=Saccharopolyspora mangrovi TaxID=3082379 RepID=A0ABU6AHE4_9PSEU|nr:Crp/Fnr family transcriptional regulator [Saccharopolyspora sp. S2-29]MEB3370960.1 Crp/Fnr family transcriptional regulator [Saccharopolyspora sp. S2-29]